MNTKRIKRKTNAEISGQMTNISDWMSSHDIADNTRFGEMRTAIGLLPKKEDLTEAVQVVAKAFDDHAKYDQKWKDDFAGKIDPVLALYQGGIFTKSLIIGLAGTIGAIAGIGYGLITIAQWLTHK